MLHLAVLQKTRDELGKILGRDIRFHQLPPQPSVDVDPAEHPGGAEGEGSQSRVLEATYRLIFREIPPKSGLLRAVEDRAKYMEHLDTVSGA